MSNSKSSGGFSALVASLTILICLVIGFLIYFYILGDKSNFFPIEDLKAFKAGEEKLEPKEGNLMGIIYMGGIIVPFLLTVNLVVIVFAVERAFGLMSSKGRGNLKSFLSNVKGLLDENDVQGAIELCDNQKGSVANVLRSGLEKYESVETDSNLDREGKIQAIKKEIEDSISLELPMMSKNMVVLSTCASVGTLVGLIGTVVGMIRSFSAMGQGQPDTAELSVGISEALINTFFGIFGSTLAIVVYNYFNTKIDQLTHSMDEAGYALVQNFTARAK
jgi:biopolymer transport protein ExbB